ncbi:MAG: prepilin-type N-terminal cleavage/methylation domain-containing protein, partial [Planctomycetota bacterium]
MKLHPHLFAIANKRDARRGFSLIELMVALAAALLLMAALTRAFGLIGTRIKDSRAELTLSAALRDTSLKLRDDLNLSIASYDPRRASSVTGGYLVYHDGPMSDATAAVAGGENLDANDGDSGYLPLSRWGDIDDFLAFTSRAPAGTKFTGMVPAGVINVSRRILGATPLAVSPETLVPVQSEYAEVVYWLAPRWNRDPADDSLIFQTDDGDDTDGINENNVPQYVDLDTDGMPDEMLLHRRVLLIRPDLNFTPNQISAAATAGRFNTFSASAFPNVGANQPVLCWVNAAGDVEAAGTSVQSMAPSFDSNPAQWGYRDNVNASSPNWMVGMANIQQRCDLSLGRDNLISGNVQTGTPLQAYSANTIEQLELPHRRFAHCRIPDTVITEPAAVSAAVTTSMPVLALCPPVELSAQLSVSGSTTPILSKPNGSGVLISATTMTGYLRPEFALEGDRMGEDVVLAGVLGFDVRIFDPQAPRFSTLGDDGEAGFSGVDDDGNGITDRTTGGIIDFAELGAIDSDDRSVGVGDPFA